MFAFNKRVSFREHNREALGRDTLAYRRDWRATCMAHGFVDLKSRRDVPRATAALLALNESASEFSVGCRPLEVQLLKHQRCAYLRVLLLVDAADMEWIAQTGWVHKYTVEHRAAAVGVVGLRHNHAPRLPPSVDEDEDVPEQERSAADRAREHLQSPAVKPLPS